ISGFGVRVPDGAPPRRPGTCSRCRAFVVGARSSPPAPPGHSAQALHPATTACGAPAVAPFPSGVHRCDRLVVSHGALTPVVPLDLSTILLSKRDEHLIAIGLNVSANIRHMARRAAPLPAPRPATTPDQNEEVLKMRKQILTGLAMLGAVA